MNGLNPISDPAKVNEAVALLRKYVDLMLPESLYTAEQRHTAVVDTAFAVANVQTADVEARCAKAHPAKREEQLL